MTRTAILSPMWILILNFMLWEIAIGQQMSHPEEDLMAAQHLLHRARNHFPMCPNSIPAKPEDCADVYRNYNNRGSGVYTIWPRSRVNEGRSVEVYCDMHTDRGGWTVIQRRDNNGRPMDYFYRGWDAYKKGFGNIERDFWLGNDNIFALTNQKEYTIRFDLYDWNNTHAYATYDSFWIDDEEKQYTLNVKDYSGTAGDSFSHHNKQRFSTRDRDNDAWNTFDCANAMKGGWWYKTCHTANLNGLYYQNGSYNTSYADGIDWSSFRGYRYSLRKTEIKIRSKEFLSRSHY